MTATVTVAYPPHRVTTYAARDNEHGVQLTRWTAACGATGTAVGTNPFKPAGQHRRLEVCTGCFPGRDTSASYPDPIDLSERRSS